MSFPFQQPEPPPELRDAIERYQKASHRLQISEREQFLYWAPIFCSCPPWWTGSDRPPQADCVVHGTVLLKPEGGWL